MDIHSKNLMVLKGALFFGIVVGASIPILLEQPTLRTALLLVVIAWAAARFYYFVFYALERYVDPELKYAGILSLVLAIARRRRAGRLRDH